MTTPRRLGILGGTFDPIHTGHLEAADAACRQLQLERVLLMPSMMPPHRHESPRASAFHRFAMVALATSGCERLLASDEDLLGAGPSYTAHMLGRLREQGWVPMELFFILGADAFGDIAGWHDYPAVLDGAQFVVVARPGTTLAIVRSRLPELSARIIDLASLDVGRAGGTKIVLVQAETPPVSSTEIRRRVRAGESLEGLTPPAIVDHITRHGLYREPDERREARGGKP